jgi:hypothetical protein
VTSFGIPLKIKQSLQTMKIILHVLWLHVYLFFGALHAQNAPVTTVGTVSSQSLSLTVPVTAKNFINIGSCNLKLNYNPAIFSAASVSAGPLLAGNINSNVAVPGEIVLGWYTFPGLTLPDNTVIFNIVFSKVSSGTSALTWNDDGASCQYADGNQTSLNDTPATYYYINGSLTSDTLYGINEPGPGIGNSVVGTDRNPLKLGSFPNPFKDHLTFTFFLPEKGKTTLDIIDASGERVTASADGQMTEGSHILSLPVMYLRPGIYTAVLTLQTDKNRITGTEKIICER